MELKTISINDFLLLFQEIESLYKQDLRFNTNVALKLLKIYKEADETYSYILNRMKMLIPSLTDKNHKLTDEEKIIYDSILLTPIEINTYGLTADELTTENDAIIGVASLEKLLKLL